MAKMAYVTDLKTLQAECSANYLRLVRLVGELESGQRRDIALRGDDQYFGDLHLTILQHAPYTTMVEVTQSSPMDTLWEGPRMRVHLYHDVRMAEVTDFQRERHFKGRYRYPNARMHQPDEKLQLNRFLGEWLAHALAHGHTVDVPELP
ncbi:MULTISPECIES: DUF1249 domain-containing protein [unclassified Halomonas]|uniref:DUF1249 domain-containing protein n=1 Tax=unclassified Halomonas TaxID=2609666 RepID=UPI0006DA6644|nr:MULTISPECIES: DUF1249 domain-containing protein [unclassified Halomonas]KPQ22747.1 MAG: hypothetical protein HLUCCO06_15320 [Halomonas sp. HL-93]SBR49845.1 hypothetical protein GA0071314_2392 [Halomonas sp. HL-93]SNY96560.1 hypothetical protein SAMN04488142_1100 [Halomonas sp. hl-4]